MPEVINLGLIGGGRTGTPLVEELSKKHFVNVVGVADLNPESPGMKFARENGIKTITDPLELARMGEQVDILIEVSGDPSLKPEIKKMYAEMGNKRTIILHDLVVRLLLSTIKGTEELVQSYHPQDKGIG